MTRTKLLVTVVLFSCCVVTPGAQRLESVRKVIDSYLVAIRLAQKNPSRGQLEAAFDAIGPLRDALVLGHDGEASPLELLSEQEFTTLGRELVGLRVNRDEVVFIKPDVVFFRRLAARGDPADRAFFAALSSTYPDSVWPIYIEPQTDFSGCTRFGSGTLVSSYLSWVAVKRQYPKRYKEASSSYLDDAIQKLTESTCACGDRASVEKELREFVRRAESSEVRTRVEARLAAVRSDRAKIRFTCVSG